MQFPARARYAPRSCNREGEEAFAPVIFSGAGAAAANAIGKPSTKSAVRKNGTNAPHPAFIGLLPEAHQSRSGCPFRQEVPHPAPHLEESAGRQAMQQWHCSPAE